jgi:hypothetical protein
MIQAFKTLLGLDAVSDNVCLFVDGLDEYDGDYDVMTEMVLHGLFIEPAKAQTGTLFVKSTSTCFQRRFQALSKDTA